MTGFVYLEIINETKLIDQKKNFVFFSITKKRWKISKISGIPLSSMLLLFEIFFWFVCLFSFSHNFFFIQNSFKAFFSRMKWDKISLYFFWGCYINIENHHQWNFFSSRYTDHHQNNWKIFFSIPETKNGYTQKKVNNNE